MIDIKGKKYNRLTPLVYLGESKWRCQCDCGKISVIRSYDIINGRTKSCGCLVKETTRNKNLKRWGESSLTHIYLTYKAGAKARGLSFNLSKEEVKELVDKPCFYCGETRSNEKKSKHNNGSYYYNGIDRVDNSFGYELSNVVPCCWKCNKGKWTMTKEDFINWIDKVYHNIHNI